MTWNYGVNLLASVDALDENGNEGFAELAAEELKAQRRHSQICRDGSIRWRESLVSYLTQQHAITCQISRPARISHEGEGISHAKKTHFRKWITAFARSRRRPLD